MATAAVDTKRTRVGWDFGLPWVLATSIGWAVGGVVLLALIGSLGDTLGNVAGDTTLGLLVGIGQWLVLRQWLDKAGWWILASAGGWLLGASLLVLQGPLGENMGGLIATIGLGLIPGTLQWLLLRQQVARAGWWVLASTVLTFVALLAGVAAGNGVAPEGSGLGFGLILGITSGLVFGITSALVLGRLLRHPAPAPMRVMPAAG
jgi:hypothetical protein